MSSLDEATINRLTALANTSSDYIAIDVDEMRELVTDHPNDATLQAWAKVNGRATGMKRIARVTLRQLLGLPKDATPEQPRTPELFPSTRITPLDA
jgi:hypothetical protein